jgi:methyltransferase (TIGR00027 family)
VDAVFDHDGSSVSQVVIMGAGYDSRSIRFRERLATARVFEVDSPNTQADKRRGLALRRLPVPSNLVFVPVDFESQTAAERLRAEGFRTGEATLWLLEGLSMYLEPATIESTFRFISDSSGAGSIVVFDYAYADVLRGLTTRYGATGVMAAVDKAGESWRFGIEEGGVAAFLAPFGFTVVDEASPAELERCYFTDPAGANHGRVNGTQALVTAVKR